MPLTTNDLISGTLAATCLSPLGSPVMQAICILLHKHPHGLTYTRLSRLIPCADAGLKKPLAILKRRTLITHLRGEPYVLTSTGRELLLEQMEKIVRLARIHAGSAETNSSLQ